MTTIRARQLRRNATDAETTLWRVLRSSNLARVKFRRQQPIGPYIADFVSFAERLIIECDGGQHAENATDVARDKWFGEQGFRTLRFWNNDVLGNREGVVRAILDAIGKGE
jgi:very-short-patch-repair endonuclease